MPVMRLTEGTPCRGGRSEGRGIAEKQLERFLFLLSGIKPSHEMRTTHFQSLEL